MREDYYLATQLASVHPNVDPDPLDAFLLEHLVGLVVR